MRYNGSGTLATYRITLGSLVGKEIYLPLRKTLPLVGVGVVTRITVIEISIACPSRNIDPLSSSPISGAGPSPVVTIESSSRGPTHYLRGYEVDGGSNVTAYFLHAIDDEHVILDCQCQEITNSQSPINTACKRMPSQ